MSRRSVQRLAGRSRTSLLILDEAQRVFARPAVREPKPQIPSVDNCILCRSPVGAGCPFHGRRS